MSMQAMTAEQAAYHTAMRDYFKGAKLIRLPGQAEFIESLKRLRDAKPEHTAGVNAWLATVKVGAA